MSLKLIWREFAAILKLATVGSHIGFWKKSNKRRSFNEFGTLERFFTGVGELIKPKRYVQMQNNGSIKSLEEIPAKYRSLFSSYPHFNSIQSQVLDNVLKTNNSMVVAAPTGSGKTGVLELAIVKLLIDVEKSGGLSEFKMIYVCPVKALCRERFDDWNPRFGKLGISCIEVTGDGGDYSDLRSYNLIITTPEKWDSLTRKWRDNSGLFQTVKLFMIDEVHLLSDNKRGPVLEAIVCRMKMISKILNSVRFFAISATIFNVEDLASWLGAKDQPAFCYKFGSEARPVTLEKIVKGYNSWKDQGFKFDIQLSYKLKGIILEHSKGKPTLIFCSSRKSVLMTAQVVCKDLTYHFSDLQKKNLSEAAASVTDSKLKELILCGVGFHHAGLIAEDRNVVQNLFVAGHLPVLTATSTLAMGVNLPAHLVIIKSTKQFNAGQTVEYPESSILQMIGRAGRPQFDQTAVAVIMTEEKNVPKYERLLDSKEILESSLHLHLPEYLNSEIVLYTITNLTVAMGWIRSTFLYVRALKNPRYYGFDPKADRAKIEKSLETICEKEINGLKKSGLIEVKESGEISPTADGRLMSHFYLSFETFKLFLNLTENEPIENILWELSNAAEFSEITLRMNERKVLNDLNKCKNKESIRFPLKGKIKTRPMKINVLIQSVLGCLPISDPSLNQESYRIVYVAERLAKCLAEFLSKKNFYGSVLNSLIFAKCLKAKLWWDSPYVCRQLERIGPTYCSLLSSCGKTSFDAIRESNPRDLERILNRAPPFGNVIQDAVVHLPKYDLKLEKTENRINITISLSNAEILREKNTAGDKHWSTLIVGDSDNNVLSYCKISDRDLLSKDWKISVVPKGNPRTITVDLISENWVGIDLSQSVEINPVIEEKEVEVEKVTRKRKSAAQNPKTPKKPRKEGKEFDFFKEYAFKPKEKESLKPVRRNYFVANFDVDIDVPEEEFEEEVEVKSKSKSQLRTVRKIQRMVEELVGTKEEEPDLGGKIRSCDFRRKNQFVPSFDVDVEILDEIPAEKKILDVGGRNSVGQNRNLMEFEESLNLALKSERESAVRVTGIPESINLKPVSQRTPVFRTISPPKNLNWKPEPPKTIGILKNLGFNIGSAGQFRMNFKSPEKVGLVDSRRISENFLNVRHELPPDVSFKAPFEIGNKFWTQKPDLVRSRSMPLPEKNQAEVLLERNLNLSSFKDGSRDKNLVGKAHAGNMETLNSSFAAEKRSQTSPVRKNNVTSLQTIYEMLKQTPRKCTSNLGI